MSHDDDGEEDESVYFEDGVPLWVSLDDIASVRCSRLNVFHALADTALTDGQVDAALDRLPWRLG